MISFPNAKINLGLNILAKRKDGYHDISTCFYPVNWYDILEIVPISRGKTSITVTGIEIPESKGHNLCIQAFRMIKKDFDIPEVIIHLHKQIPLGSGLGGGSSNAAETLKMLDKMFNLFLDEDLLAWYALKLGSDCPFFIYNKPLMASGRGEVFEEIKTDLAGKFIVVINPGFSVSTVEAFRFLQPGVPEISIGEIIENEPIEKWKETLRNDFEEIVLKKYPQLTDIKNKLYGAGSIYVSLTGSGSGIYGIFNQAPDSIPAFPPEFLTWSGFLQ